MQVCKGGLAFRLKKHLMIEHGGTAVGVQQPETAGTAEFIFRIFLHFRHRDMRTFCEKFNRFLKAAPLNFHDEIDDISACFAAKTIIELMLRIHGKGSGLLPVERAQAPVFAAGFLQPHISGYDLNNIRTGTKLIQPSGGIARCHEAISPHQRSQNAGKEEGANSAVNFRVA